MAFLHRGRGEGGSPPSCRLTPPLKTFDTPLILAENNGKSSKQITPLH